MSKVKSKMKSIFFNEHFHNFNTCCHMLLVFSHIYGYIQMCENWTADFKRACHLFVGFFTVISLHYAL